jgi:hypothetical protein
MPLTTRDKFLKEPPMFSRPCFAFAATALAVATAAAAQTPEEMAGSYHMTLTSKFGPCDTDPSFEIEVRNFESGNVTVILGGRPYTVPFDAAAKRWYVDTRDDDIGMRATMDGRFSRTADAVVLDADGTWAVGCGGHIRGSRPAANTGTVDTGTTTTGTGDGTTGPGIADGGDQPGIVITGEPPDTYTFGGASAPQPVATCPPTGMNLWMCISLALIMFILGVFVGWLLFHGDEERRERKRKANSPAVEKTPDEPSEGSN